MTFDTFRLHPKILQGITKAGYSKPTTIQIKAIPEIMSGNDIRASAQTGTGKTAAFLLPALNRIASPSSIEGKGPRVLILVPTRELAMQITEQTEKYSRFLPRVKTVCVVGGVPYPVQMRKLSRHCDVLIATPGRLIDFIDRGMIDFSRLEMMVLDEADRMLDMGFVDPVEKIVAATPAARQMLLFSATLQGSVIKLSERLLKNPIEIAIQAKREEYNINQSFYYSDDLNHKNRLLKHILNQDEVKTAIVFTSTKRHADQLVRDLRDSGFDSAALHGNMNQRQRTRTITQFKKGKIKILVATDVAARGIDVQAITHVINFDLPSTVDDYIHRIGRTGRAGATGTALSFVTGRDTFIANKIVKFTGKQIKFVEIPGLEPRAQTRSSESPRRSHSPRDRNRRSKVKASKYSKIKTSKRSNDKATPPTEKSYRKRKGGGKGRKSFPSNFGRNR